MIAHTGLGLRSPYFQSLLSNTPASLDNSINWLEFLADQYFEVPEFLLKKLDQIRMIYPCVLHSVNLSIAGEERLSSRYLKFLKNMIERYQPEWISDHLCISRFGNIFVHDLWPIDFNYKTLDRIARRIDLIQTKFKKLFLIENISAYFKYDSNNFSDLSEGEFLKKLIEKTGCGLLLDINNIFVTANNYPESSGEFLEKSIENFLDKINFKSVKQIHLAGAEYQDGLWVDTHSREVSQEVLACFAKIQSEHGPIPTCLEWDNDLPSFDRIFQEAHKIEQIILTPKNFINLSGVIKTPEKNPEKILEKNKEKLAQKSDQDRLLVYYKSMQGTLAKVLDKTFKPLRKILGESVFKQYIYNYSSEYYSEDFNLNLYGESFPEFLGKDRLIEKNFPYLKDLASFCYYWRQVYSRESIPGVYMNFDYDVYALWQQCQPEYLGLIEIPTPRLFECLLHREEDKVKVKVFS